MSEKTGVTFESAEFDESIKKLLAVAEPGQAGAAVFEAGAALIRDSQDEAPQVPWKKGHLRASAFIEKPQIDGDGIFVDVGYDMPYAAYQHEGQRKDGSHVIKKWTTGRVSSPGIKFLEKKMIKNSGKYLKEMANYLRKLLGAS